MTWPFGLSFTSPFLFCFETGSCSVSQNGLDLLVPLCFRHMEESNHSLPLFKSCRKKGPNGPLGSWSRKPLQLHLKTRSGYSARAKDLSVSPEQPGIWTFTSDLLILNFARKSKSVSFQSIKCLLNKLESLSLAPQHQCKSLGVAFKT